VTKREELEAALAKAEAALVVAVISSATVDGDRVEANANLDKARAYCRQVRGALVELNHTESMACSGEHIDARTKLLEEVSKQGATATASPPSRQLSEHVVRGENKRSHDESRQRKPIHRLDIGFSAREPGPGDTLARPPLVRQTIGLSALILAYLLYFHIDVQLQIMSLPSIFE
jgi:hypothetical protein